MSPKFEMKLLKVNLKTKRMKLKLLNYEKIKKKFTLG